MSAVFSFLNIFVQTNWKTFASYVSTISKETILRNSEYNGIAARHFSKGTKVTLHTVVSICQLFSHFGNSNHLGNNYLL